MYSELTLERAEELFILDTDTGVITRRMSPNNRCKVGEVVGNLRGDGYLQTQIDGKCFAIHRIVFLMFNGFLPPDLMVDHCDRNKLNNAPSNLRLVTNQCNLRNQKIRTDNSSSVRGICFASRDKKWKAYITVNGKFKSLGDFDNIEEAVAHRLAAEQCLDWAGCDSYSPALRFIQCFIKGVPYV